MDDRTKAWIRTHKLLIQDLKAALDDVLATAVSVPLESVGPELVAKRMAQRVFETAYYPNMPSRAIPDWATELYRQWRDGHVQAIGHNCPSVVLAAERAAILDDPPVLNGEAGDPRIQRLIAVLYDLDGRALSQGQEDRIMQVVEEVRSELSNHKPTEKKEI